MKFNVDEACDFIQPYIKNNFSRTYLFYIITIDFKDEKINKVVRNNEVEKAKSIAKIYNKKIKTLYKKCDMIALWQDWSTNLFFTDVLNNIKYIKNFENTEYKEFQKYNKLFIKSEENKKIINNFVDNLLCKNTKILNNKYENDFLK